MRLGIVGAGKAGVSLGRYLPGASEITLTGFLSRTEKSAGEGADFTDSRVYTSIDEMVLDNDIILIATPDGEIAHVWERIRGCLDETKEMIIGHLSGALSSELFSDKNYPYIHGISIHPVYAFSDRFSSYEKLNTAFFTLEGDSYAVSFWKKILTELGNKTATVEASKKVKYHAACSMASNHLLGLISKCVRLLSDCGFDEASAYTMLEPLVKNNVNGAFTSGVQNALTGPIERNDLDTVKKHLQVLEDDETLYKELGKAVLSIAETKHEDIDYQKVRDLLWQ